MTAPFNELHSLIVYIIFGYTLLLPLLLIGLKVFAIKSPLQRSRLYLLAFLTPPAAFILYHTVLVKRCQSGLPPLWFEGAFHLFCLLSEAILRAVIPLLVLLLIFSLLKAFAALLMIKRLEHDSFPLNPANSMLVNDILMEKSVLLGISPPRLLFSKRKGFAAFSTGFFKPVLVINSFMPELLGRREMEALISHELIHIQHRDTFKSWLLHLVRDLTFLNPFSSLLLKNYLLEKEALCDLEAAKLSGQSPHEYASVLLKVWRSILDQPKFRLGLSSSFTGRSGMERRVENLLQGSKAGRNKLASSLSTLLGMTIFVTTLLILGLVC